MKGTVLYWREHGDGNLTERSPSVPGAFRVGCLQRGQHWWTCNLQSFTVACEVVDATALLQMAHTGMSPLPPGSKLGQGPGAGSMGGKLSRQGSREWEPLLQRPPVWTEAEGEPWHTAARLGEFWHHLLDHRVSSLN